MHTPELTRDTLQDRQAIAANVANFALRDQADWAGLRDLFTADGSIVVTWYQGGIDGFIAGSQRMSADQGTTSKHQIATPRIQLCGDRAISETDVTITGRTRIASVEVDLVSHARFFDTFQRDSDGHWRVVKRVAIYEKDRIDPVAPSLLFPLIYRLAGFGKYPAQYRHIAAGLARKGYSIQPMIVSGSLQEAELKASARQWAGC